jgi:enhancing lycopene biosynthesis protein 2
MKKFAVILSGCGHRDGSEIHEAVTLLLSLDQHHCEYQCFAPNRSQHDVVNHLTGEAVKEERNILTEAARIARGRILSIEDYKAEDYDGLLFSGGFGAAKNLCNYAFKGADMEVQPDVARAIVETREAGKPLGGMCISPVMFAKLLPGVCITLGNEGTPDADNVRKMGAFHVQTEHGDVCADNELLVFTTPAYMLDATVKDVYDGAYNMVEAILETIEDDRRK